MEAARKRLIMTTEEWEGEGFRIFRTRDKQFWEFVCPSCGRVIMAKEYNMLNVPHYSIARDCIGVWNPTIIGSCDWGDGACRFVGNSKNLPVEVIGVCHNFKLFHFADGELGERVDGPGGHCYYKHYAGR